MARYILKRIVQTVLTAWVTVTIVFLLLRLAPGDPAVSLRATQPDERAARGDPP